MLVVTTEGLPGYEITTVLGEVLGVVATSRNPFAAGIRSTEGGPGQDMSQFLVQTRSRAVGQMVQVAERRGANAIVGMRFDHRDVTNTWVELCAYGTAVVAVPVNSRTGAHAAA